jgi:hypothetical protein
MMAQRIHRNSPNFRIFTGQIVPRDKRLNLVAHRFVDRHLSRDCSTACGFGTTTSFEQCTSVTSSNTTQLSGTFTPGKRAAQPSLERFYC